MQDWFEQNAPKTNSGEDWFAANAPTSPAGTIEYKRETARRQFEANLPVPTAGTQLQDIRDRAINTIKSIPSGLSELFQAGISGNPMRLVQDVAAIPQGIVKPPIDYVKAIYNKDPQAAATAAADIITNTLPAVEGTYNLAKNGIRTMRTPAAPGTAQDIYRSALKAPTTMSAAKVAQIVQTGLEHEIPISEAGVTKLAGLVDDLNRTIDAKVQGSGGTVNKYQVASRLNQTAKDFASQATPTKDLQAISDVGNDFLDTKPVEIPNEQAQDIKKGTYTQLRKKYGQLGTAEVEAQKALARGIKEELAKQIPELTDLNAKEAQFLQLDPVLERAVNRAANANKGRIGPMILGGVTKTLTGSTAIGTAMGIMKAVLDDPELASKLAIAINRAQQANPTKYGPPNITSAYAKVGALSAALNAAARTSADSSEKE